MRHPLSALTSLHSLTLVLYGVIKSRHHGDKLFELDLTVAILIDLLDDGIDCL